jgi:hypothetical protein
LSAAPHGRPYAFVLVRPPKACRCSFGGPHDWAFGGILESPLPATFPMVAVTNAEEKLITAPRSPPGEACGSLIVRRPLFGLIGRKLLQVAPRHTPAYLIRLHLSSEPVGLIVEQFVHGDLMPDRPSVQRLIERRANLMRPPSPCTRATNGLARE